MNTLVIIPDLQVPNHDAKALMVALKLIEYIKPTQVAFIGDVVSADAVSSFAKKSFEEAALTLDNEIKATNKVLDQFDKVFNKIKVKTRMFLAGNHEDRILHFILKNAVSFGDMEGLRLESLLKFKDRGYTYYPTKKQPVKINHFYLIHGLYTNQYHASKTVKMTHRNTIYGHSHDYSVYTGDHFHNDAPKLAMCIGCLCNFKQPYINGPTNWMHGVAIVHYDKKGFTPLFIPIVNYRCIYDGKVFEV